MSAKSSELRTAAWGTCPGGGRGRSPWKRRMVREMEEQGADRLLLVPKGEPKGQQGDWF